MSSDARAKDLDSRVRSDLVDSFDEELEMEIDDARLDKVIQEFAERPEQARRHRSRHSTSRSCSACRASWSSCRTGWSSRSSRSS